MTTQAESVCCHDYRQTLSTIGEAEFPIDCITEHPGFSTVCLDVHVLRTAYQHWRQDLGDEADSEADELVTQHE